MYVSSRLLRASSSGVLPQSIAMVNHVLEHINSKHGTDFGAGVAVGGDPVAIGINGAFESLADYEKVRAALQTDAEYQAAVQMGDHLFENTTEDGIWNVRIPPGDRDAVSAMSSARVELTRIVEATTFAAEVAATVTEITGSTTGMATAVTGDRSRLVWVGYGSSLAELEANNDKLEANEEYRDLFKRGDGLIQPNTLEQAIWMRVSS